MVPAPTRAADERSRQDMRESCVEFLRPFLPQRTATGLEKLYLSPPPFRGHRIQVAIIPRLMACIHRGRLRIVQMSVALLYSRRI